VINPAWTSDMRTRTMAGNGTAMLILALMALASAVRSHLT
jgi:hypothetical protein